jgi:hypothetical protein
LRGRGSRGVPGIAGIGAGVDILEVKLGGVLEMRAVLRHICSPIYFEAYR